MTYINKYCIINTDFFFIDWIVPPKNIYSWQTTVTININKMQKNKKEKDF